MSGYLIFFLYEINYEIDWLSSKLNSIGVQKVLYRMGFPDNYKEISYIE